MILLIFYKVSVIVETENSNEATDLVERMIKETKYKNIWLKYSGKEMSEEQILEFFDKIKAEMYNISL